MREILFRGKRIDNGEWETGSLVYARMGTSEEQVGIADKMTAYHTPVIPETVGQYTGLTDKNDKKIFEGDIVKFIDIDFDGSERKAVGVMAWNRKAANFDIVKGTYRLDFHYPTLFEEIEVIGNIYDNPELMGGDTHG